jgi:hypothetical protein
MVYLSRAMDESITVIGNYGDYGDDGDYGDYGDWTG